jgi:hypothetical protein
MLVITISGSVTAAGEAPAKVRQRAMRRERVSGFCVVMQVMPFEAGEKGKD